MDIKTFRRKGVLLLLSLLMIGILFYAITHKQLSEKTEVVNAVAFETNVGELLKGSVVEQSLKAENDILNSFSLFFQTYERTNTSHMDISLWDGENLLYQEILDTSTLADNSFVAFSPNLTDVKGKTLTLQITSLDAEGGNGVTLGYGSNVNIGRGSIPVALDSPVRLNREPLNGKLCIELTTTRLIWFGSYYWYFLAGVLLLTAGYLMWLQRRIAQGKDTLILRFINAMQKYRFLLQQLVSRDFKTKYKRSVLGIFWSFLNPLLTMMVQYVVFSTLFRSDIPNYPVYLFCGVICYSYFSEATAQCMVSIIGNAHLITKVYVPKYIYPLSKALSSAINLLFSLFPLLIVMLVTKLWPTPAILLLPFGILCLFMVVLGMGMFLATSTVFFRDTQFLWGVISLLWMYLTPIFYPESIIPAQFMPIYRLNPLYHVIGFIRSILIDGVSPEPMAYLLCLLTCSIPLLLGLFVFKKNQDKFILYI